MPNVGFAKFQWRASAEPGLTSAMHSTSFGGFSTGDCGFGMEYPLAQVSNPSTIIASCFQMLPNFPPSGRQDRRRRDYPGGIVSELAEAASDAMSRTSITTIRSEEHTSELQSLM